MGWRNACRSRCSSFPSARSSGPALKNASGLPKHIEAAIDAFEHGLTDEEMKDPAYRISYGFVPMVAKKPGAADTAVHIVSGGSDEAGEISKIILKEVNKDRYGTSPSRRIATSWCARVSCTPNEGDS
jgi:hypothetical protein